MDNVATSNVEKPSPQTTLVVLLGAHHWPYHSQLKDSDAFSKSAKEIWDYFLLPLLFGLPPENRLDLFDRYQSSPDEVDRKIHDFLAQRISALRQTGTPARDLLFYYIGHGVFDAAQKYHLAILSTREANIGASAVAMASLAYTLKTQARNLRRIVILDSCFSAQASSYLAPQSAIVQAAQFQVQSAFEEKSKGSGFPRNGTALFCSSGQQDQSFLLRDESGTMFSKALAQALRQGNVRQPNKTHLSLHELKFLTEEALAKEAPQMFIDDPDQHDGQVTLVPFFPNPKANEEQHHQVEEAEYPGSSPDELQQLTVSTAQFSPIKSITRGVRLMVCGVIFIFYWLAIGYTTPAIFPDRILKISGSTYLTILLQGNSHKTQVLKILVVLFSLTADWFLVGILLSHVPHPGLFTLQDASVYGPILVAICAFLLTGYIILYFFIKWPYTNVINLRKIIEIVSVTALLVFLSKAFNADFLYFPVIASAISLCLFIFGIVSLGGTPYGDGLQGFNKILETRRSSQEAKDRESKAYFDNKNRNIL